MSTCSSCGAPIIWATTTNGKSMPVDPDPHPAGNVTLTDALFPGTPPEATVTAGPIAGGHRSHFVTCPHAATWRNHRART